LSSWNWEKTEGFRPLTGKTPRGLGKNPRKNLSEFVRNCKNLSESGRLGQFWAG
jgi:hypothetical protein